MNTAAVVVGAVVALVGLSAIVAGYDYYVTMKDADERLHETLEELGLSEIPGLIDFGDRAKVGLAASMAGSLVAFIGGVVLAYGLLKKTGDTPPHLNLPPGATNFCEHCGKRVSPNAASCPCCGRQIDQS